MTISSQNLEIIKSPKGLLINSFQLYKTLGYSASNYNQWYHTTLKSKGKHGVDFFDNPDNRVYGFEGNRKYVIMHYLVTIKMAIGLCFCSKSPSAYKVRKNLENIENYG